MLASFLADEAAFGILGTSFLTLPLLSKIVIPGPNVSLFVFVEGFASLPLFAFVEGFASLPLFAFVEGFVSLPLFVFVEGVTLAGPF